MTTRDATVSASFAATDDDQGCSRLLPSSRLTTTRDTTDNLLPLPWRMTTKDITPRRTTTRDATDNLLPSLQRTTTKDITEFVLSHDTTTKQSLASSHKQSSQMGVEAKASLKKIQLSAAKGLGWGCRSFRRNNCHHGFVCLWVCLYLFLGNRIQKQFHFKLATRRESESVS